MTSGKFPDPMVLDIHWTLGLLDIAEIVTGSCLFSLSFSIGGSACGMGILLFFSAGSTTAVNSWITPYGAASMRRMTSDQYLSKKNGMTSENETV